MRRRAPWWYPGRRVPVSRVLLAVVALCAAVDARAAPIGPRHWVHVGGDLPDVPVTAVAVDPVDDQIVLVGTDGFVFKTDDGGESWRPVLSFARGLAVDLAGPPLDRRSDQDIPGQSREVAEVEVETHSDESIDQVEGDATTETDAEGPSIGDVDVDEPEGEEAGGDQVIEVDAEDLPEGDVGDDATATTLLRTAPGVRVIRFLKESPGTVWVATARGLFRSVDRGEHFVQIELPGGPETNDVRDLVHDPLRPSRLYLATARGLVVTRDGATTFQTGPGAAGTTPALCVAVDASSGETQVLVGTEAGLHRSRDGGQTFLELLLKGTPKDEPITALAFAVDGAITYAGTRSGLFASERGAAILERREAFSGDSVTAVSPDPKDPRGVAVGFFSTGVQQSLNTGIDVVADLAVLPAAKATALARDAKDKDALYVATDRGVFRSTPGTGIVEDADRLKRLRARLAKEPDVQALARAALDHAALPADMVDGLALRARWAWVLPELTARYRFRSGRTSARTFRLVTGGDVPFQFIPGVDDPAVTGDQGAFSISPAVGVVHVGTVIATWDLDRMVFDREELRASRAGMSIGRGQGVIIGRVHELWAARRRLLVQVALGADQPKGAQGEVVRRLQLQQLTAQLDAATGDLLSREARKNGVEADDLVDLVGPLSEASGAAPSARRRTR